MKSSQPDTAEASDSTFGLTSRAETLHHKALGLIAKLDAMASRGDPVAIRLFHSMTCGMVNRLNELYPDSADAVLKWPVLLPQDRKSRNAVTKKANEMRIGSVKAGGKGRPEELGYDSEKGFAIQNLRRLSYARAILITLTSEDGILDLSNCEGDEISTMEAFTKETEIAQMDEAVLLEIRDLPEYCPASKSKWIGLILKVLRMNPVLVPQSLASRASTRKQEYCGGKSRTIIEERGGVLRKALQDGLLNVSAVPGVWGDK